MTVKIITDSTAGIPDAICQQLDITVIPVTIHFGSDTFVDGVDPAEAFYERLRTSAVPPTTSTPSPGTFLDHYRLVADGGATSILAVHLFGNKSGVVATAEMAAQMMPDIDIRVVDSGTTTLGLGLIVMEAARAAQSGEPPDAIVAMVRRRAAASAVHVAIADLTQLRRSGRVSLGQALVAGVLGIKPLLRLGQGEAAVVDKVRSWPKAVERMVELAVADVAGRAVSLAVVHTNAAAEAERLLAVVRERFVTAQVLVAEAGSALAAHAGAGALGVVTIPLA